MKKGLVILMTLLLGNIGLHGQQNIDIAVFLNMFDSTCLNLGDVIINDSADAASRNPVQPWGDFGAINASNYTLNGNYAVDFIDPNSRLTSEGITVISLQLNDTAIPPNARLSAWGGFPVDSVNTLVDLDSLAANVQDWGRLLVPRSRLVSGKLYGFYIQSLGARFNGVPIPDPNSSNDFAMVPVYWDRGCPPRTTTVKDLIEKAAYHIVIAPNPVEKTLNFQYGFIRNTVNCEARIIDVLGRVVMTKAHGSQQVGLKSFQWDLSDLPTGNYMLELMTDDYKAVERFIKQ